MTKILREELNKGRIYFGSQFQRIKSDLLVHNLGQNHEGKNIMIVNLGCELERGKLIWKEGTSTEELSPSDWPVSM